MKSRAKLKQRNKSACCISALPYLRAGQEETVDWGANARRMERRRSQRIGRLAGLRVG